MDTTVNWLKQHILHDRGLISKKCKKEWFDKYNFSNQYQEILNFTNFLDEINPSLPQRIWHLLNNKLEKNKCKNQGCSNTTSFFSFNRGYLDNCGHKCAQKNTNTSEKIKSTNLKKYGVEYGLSNKDVINKRNQTVRNKYGVDNISQLKETSEKKKQTCLNNYGVEWILMDSVIRRNGMIEKYGVDNNTKRKEIREKYSKERRESFYDSLFSTNRLNGKIVPMFTKEEYKGSTYDHIFKCIKCSNEFVDKLEDGDIPRCKICYPVSGSSLFEKEITEYIKTLLPNDIVLENDKKVLNGLELDIYIPSKNIAIECNGLYWHSENGGNKNKRYHINKTNECEKQNIHLIHVFDDEWIDKEYIVKSKLRHILNSNVTDKKVYARNCVIKEVTISEKNEFLQKYHIQGEDYSQIKLGAFYQNELVAVMTFGKPRVAMGHKNINKDDYELIRFATSKNVVGIASKLLSYFTKLYTPQKIISYADRRWTYMNKNVYEKIGFVKISNGTPNYWYISPKSNKRIYRYNFRKQTLKETLQIFDPNLTEWQNMQLNDYDRIWDCGSIKYELICK